MQMQKKSTIQSTLTVFENAFRGLLLRFHQSTVSRTRRRCLTATKILCFTAVVLMFLSTTDYARRALLPVFGVGIKHCVYINLDRRPDRKEQVEKQLKRAGLNCIRIPAVDISANDTVALEGCWDGGLRQCPGKIGCQRSHVAALSYAQRHQWEHVAVFEDDFEWFPAVEPSRVQRIIRRVQSLHDDWSVIILSANVAVHELIQPEERIITQKSPSTTSKVTLVKDAQTTHGYMVRGRYIGTVLEAFATCDVKAGPSAAIDSCWKSLQTEHWYGFVPNLGTQAPGYSDVEKEVVNYPGAFDRT